MENNDKIKVYDYEDAVKFNNEKKDELNNIFEDKKDVLQGIADLQKQLNEKKKELLDAEKIGTAQQVRFLKRDIRNLMEDIEKKLKDSLKGLNVENVSDLRLAVTLKLQYYRDDLTSEDLIDSRKEYKATLTDGKKPEEDVEKFANAEKKRLNGEIKRLKAKKKPFEQEIKESRKKYRELTKEAEQLALDGDAEAADKKHEEARGFLKIIAENTKEIEPINNKLYMNQMFLDELKDALENSINNSGSEDFTEYDMLYYANEALSEFYYDYFDLEEEPEEPAVETEDLKGGTDKGGTDDVKGGKNDVKKDHQDSIDMKAAQRDVEFNNLINELEKVVKEIKADSPDFTDADAEKIFKDIKAEYEKHYTDSNTRDDKMNQELREKFETYLNKIAAAVDWNKEGNTEKANEFFDRLTNKVLTRFFGEVYEDVKEEGEPIVKTEDPVAEAGENAEAGEIVQENILEAATIIKPEDSAEENIFENATVEITDDFVAETGEPVAEAGENAETGEIVEENILEDATIIKPEDSAEENIFENATVEITDDFVAEKGDNDLEEARIKLNEHFLQEDFDKDFKDALKKLEEYLKEVNTSENEESIDTLLTNTLNSYTDKDFIENAQKSSKIARQMRNLYDELANLYSEVVFTGNEKEDNKKIAYLEVLMLKVLSCFSKKVDLARASLTGKKILDDNTISHDALETLGLYWSVIEDKNEKLGTVKKRVKPDGFKEVVYAKDESDEGYKDTIPVFGKATIVKLMEENKDRLDEIGASGTADYISKMYYASNGLHKAVNLNEKIDPVEFVQAITTLVDVPENKKATIDYSDFLTKIGEYSKLSREEQSGEISDISLVLLASNIMRALSVDAFEKPEIEKVETVADSKKEEIVTKEETNEDDKTQTDPIRNVLISKLNEYKECIVHNINVLNNNDEAKEELENKFEELIEIYDNGKSITFEKFDQKLKAIRDMAVLTADDVDNLDIIEKNLKTEVFADHFIGSLGKTQKEDNDEYYDYKDGQVHRFSEVSLETEDKKGIVSNEEDMPELFLKFVDAQAVEDAIAEIEEFLSEKTQTKRYKGPKGLFEALKTKAQLFKQNAFLYRTLRKRRMDGTKGDSPLEAIQKLRNPAERKETMNLVTERLNKEIADLRSGAILPSQEDKLTQLMSRTIRKHRTNSLGLELYEKFHLANHLNGSKQNAVKRNVLLSARDFVLRTMHKNAPRGGLYAEFSGKEGQVYSPRDGRKMLFLSPNGSVAKADEPGLKYIYYQDIIDQLDVNIRVQEVYRAEKEAQKEAEKNDDEVR